MTDTIITTAVFTEAQEQLRKACAKHPPYPTLHHGISVIDEEFIELKTEAYRQNVDWAALRKEAFHVAVTALRLVLDIADKEKFDATSPAPKWPGGYDEHGDYQLHNAPILEDRRHERAGYPFDEEARDVVEAARAEDRKHGDYH